MTTTVVIPVFNGLEFLKKNLPAVVNLKTDEVIVVDDASTDGSGQFIKEKFPQVTLISNNTNRRFPVSVNKGFSHSSGEIIFLLNQDVKPDKDLVKNTLDFFNDPGIFAITFNEGNRSWAKVKTKNGFLEFENGEIDDKTHESFWASGGSAAFRKDMWDKLGGFDPIFTPGYFEDLDLGWRARRVGYKIIWNPKSKVTHVTETAFNKAFSKKTLQRIKERNYLLAHWKNLSWFQYPEHLFNLLLRIFKNPGYFIPVGMALWKKLAS